MQVGVEGAKIVSTRRRAPANAATRARLIEAAEQIIREEGYAAVSSRTLADRLNLKRQIVHYYFRSMDDVFIAVIRRGAERQLARLEAALQSEEPLRAVWELSRNPGSAILMLELNALANRRPAVRAEVKQVAEKFRDIQARALQRHLESRGIKPRLDPLVATVMMTSLSQVLALESSIDVTLGHAQTLELVEESLRALAEGRYSSRRRAPAPRS